MKDALIVSLSFITLASIYHLAHSPTFITALADLLQGEVKRLRAWATAQAARQAAYTKALSPKRPARPSLEKKEVEIAARP
jgi:hypothetical protein